MRQQAAVPAPLPAPSLPESQTTNCLPSPHLVVKSRYGLGMMSSLALSELDSCSSVSIRMELRASLRKSICSGFAHSQNISLSAWAIRRQCISERDPWSSRQRCRSTIYSRTALLAGGQPRDAGLVKPLHAVWGSKLKVVSRRAPVILLAGCSRQPTPIAAREL